MVAMVESISSFAPTKTPMAALHHKVAPVFNPFTLPFSLKMKHKQQEQMFLKYFYRQ